MTECGGDKRNVDLSIESRFGDPMTMMWASRTYTGGSAEPVTWDELLTVFDAIFGEDTRLLKRYPETLHHVHASWIERDGNQREAGSLDDVRQAYEGKLTYKVEFSGFREGGRQCSFAYFPGLKPPTAHARLRAQPSAIEPMLDVVREMFPIQRQFVFLSWSGVRAKAVAKALKPIIGERLPAGAEVFFSETDIIPGDDPLKTMFDDRLLPAAVQIPVLTEVSHLSPWLIWETAAAWAMQRLVIPLFVSVDSNDLAGPVAKVRQGIHLEVDGDIDRLLARTVQALGGSSTDPVTEEEKQSLSEAAQTLEA
jgi:hypothetical protein